MRKKPTLKKAIILLTVIALLLCALPTVLALTKTSDPIRSVIQTVSSPFTKLFSKAGEGAADALASRRQYGLLEDQYKEALDEIGKLREQLALLEQLKKENEQLREYLDLRGDRPEWVLTDAEVIYNNDPTGKTVTLNKGSRHGIALGMPVISAGGLFGIVSEVSASSCRVTTLQDEETFVGARVIRSGVNATLCGRVPGEDFCKLQYLDAGADPKTALAVGDVIVTNGYGEKYPGGIAIGEIVSVGVDEYDRSPYAYVRLYADYTSPATLLIIMGEKDAQDQTPTDGEVSGHES